MSRLVPLTDDDYPAEDDQPMAETPFHAQVVTLFQQALEDFFAGRADVFLASDINWYWEEGNLDAVVAPDTLVAVGVEPKPLADRRCYFQWREGGVVPALVFEAASKSTWRADLAGKMEQYQALGVPEYVVYDPQARYLRKNPLRLFRLSRGQYRPVRPVDGAFPSRLGLRLRAEGELLRVIDGRTGQPILTRRERAEAERQRAEAERQRATEAERLTAYHQGRADALAAEVERLRALLGNPPP